MIILITIMTIIITAKKQKQKQKISCKNTTKANKQTNGERIVQF